MTLIPLLNGYYLFGNLQIEKRFIFTKIDAIVKDRWCMFSMKQIEFFLHEMNVTEFSEFSES